MPKGLLIPAVVAVILLAPAPGRAEGKGFLGVEIEFALDGSGVVVLDVLPNTTAAQIKLMVGDVIARIDAKQVKSTDDFIQTISARKPGDKVVLGVIRNGKEEKIEATLGERPKEIDN